MRTLSSPGSRECSGGPAPVRGKAEVGGTVRANKFHQTCRGIGDGMQAKGTMRNTGSPNGDCSMDQLATRERQAGPFWDGGEARCTDGGGEIRGVEGGSVARKRKRRERPGGLAR